MDNIILSIAERYKLHRRADRWVGPCPKCGGSATSDKFNIRDDGGYKCYACDFRGDIITWLREIEGMNCAQAHQASGKDCAAQSCAVRETCPVVGGSGNVKKQRPHYTHREKDGKRVATVTVDDPSPRWRKWAVEFLLQAIERLTRRADILEWLAARGIDGKAAAMFRLGWNDKSISVDRASIDLPPRADGKKTLWVPQGLVIPTMDAAGKLHRLRIRRPLADREKFLPKLKYVFIEGSGRAPMVLQPSVPIRGAAVIEAELDAIAVAAAHTQILSISVQTAMGGIPETMRRELQQLPVILVALDADPDKDGKPGAGREAITVWTNDFRNAKAWPVPQGKDPGHYAELGGNLRLWIEAGLPPVALAHDLLFSADCNPQGVRGKKNHPSSPEKTKDRQGAVPAQQKSERQQQNQGAVPALGNDKRQQQNSAATRTEKEKTDPLFDRIKGMPEPDRAAALTVVYDRIKDMPEQDRESALLVYRIISGHPVEVWMSVDGSDAGIIDVRGDWRHLNAELSRRLAAVLYGPSCEAIFTVFRERFVLAGRRYRKVTEKQREAV